MKKKLSTVLAVSMIATNVSPAVNVFADEIKKEKVKSVENFTNIIEATKATVSRFDVYYTDKIEAYDKKFKMSNDNIESITNNGGQYSSSALKYAIDGNLNTHWETGKANSDTFTNEVVFDLNEVTVLNRIAYKGRNGNKGFAKEFEIWGSTESEGDNFTKVSEGSSNITGDLIEIKFNPTNFKRIKFVYKNAHQNMAAAGEFMFYKQDELFEKMNRLFTDSSMSKVSEEFNTIEKLNELENEVKEHPLYEDFKESIENAKILITQNKIEASVASTKKFEHYDNKNYSKLFKMPLSNIKSIKNNAGHYSSQVIANAIDGNLDTYWETNKGNSDSFNNEVEVEFKDKVTLNRVVYGARQNDRKGFAKEFEIYGSRTSKGDTYELVSTGKHDKTTSLVEAKFNPTEFKRLKFKFVKSDQNWATLNEISFYTQDELFDKVNNLFTDGSKYKLKDEYKNADLINNLEKQVSNHPLRDSLLDDINIAKMILNDDNEEQSTSSSIEVSEIAKSKNLEKYDEQYKIQTSEYKSVTNNGKHYGKSVLTKLYDNNKNTHWETGTANSNTFKNELVFTFNEIQEIEKIMMSSRKDANHKGFPLEYEIYGSLDESSDEYKLISKGSTKNVFAEDTEILIPKTKFKKLKFKFVTAYQNMAGLAEMSFYKEDTVTKKVNSLFEDKLYTKLSDDYNTIDKLNSLEKEVNNHPLKDNYMQLINLAKGLLNENTVSENTVITLSQRGDVNKQRDERRQIFAGGNLDLTGYYVMPGESVEVYVDADKNSVLPKLVFAQVGEVDNNNKSNYKKSLSVGRNVVTAPEGTKGYAIYFENSALPEEQAYAPKVRISGANLKSYPVYIDGKTDPKEYVEQVKNHKGENMTDVMGDRFLLSVKNSEAKIAYIDREKTPVDTVNAMEKFIKAFDKLSGYDINDPNPIHRPSNALYHYKATNGSGLFASNEYVHLDAGSAREMLSGKAQGWGFGHEFGHQIENKDMRLLEVTNNLYSIYLQKEFGKIERNLSGNQANVDKYFTFEGTKGFGGFEGDDFEYKFGLFERLLVITQITNYFGDEAYTNAYRLLRENPSRYNSTGSYQAIITAMSESTGYDLSSHFEYYNYPVTEKTKEFTSQFKPLDKKIRYTTIEDYKKIEDNVETFNESTKAVISYVKQEDDGFTLNLSTSDENKGTIAYEIYRDGKLVGFNRTGIYKDIVDSSKEYKYEVVAYDYRVNESIKSDAFNTESIIYKPLLNIEESINIVKNETFDPLKYVQATTFDGKEIDKSRIKVTNNNVDTKTKGKYEVTYEVEDRGYTSTKTMNVVVYEELKVQKSKYGQFDNLDKYNEEFKIKVVSVSNNAGNYPGSPISNAIDKNVNTHWETNNPNSDKFKNEVIFDLGESQEISKIAYAARRNAGGKGFANKFEIYVSNEAEGNDFILAGKGEYRGNSTDVVEFNISKTTARRVKFKFVEANQNWASIGEMSFYKEDTLADKITNDLFTDSTKTEVSEDYNTLEELEALREEVKDHPAVKLFEEDLNKAEEIIRAKFPTLNFEEITYVKVNSNFDLMDGVSASDKEDGNLTPNVKVDSKKFNINRGGEYTLTYTVTDSNNNITTKERKVIVYNDNPYLTDLDWESAVSGWKSVNKDSAVNTKDKIKLNVNGEVKEFDRGIGAATNAEIVYNLDGNYNYFTTYVGTDKNYDHNRTTIRFKIFADGKEVYTSDVIRKNSEAEFVNLNVAGVKELKLVADDVDNNGLGDFASWGDSKLYSIEKLYITDLEKAIEEAEKLELNNYSDKTVIALEKVLTKAKEALESGNQELIDSATQELKNAMDSLVEVDLNEVVNIPDKYLAESIQEQLNKTGDITIGDMRSLTTLTLFGVENLTGMEYAINLETLSMDYNEVKDLRPLAKLKKLKNLSASQQFVVSGVLNPSNGKIVADSKIYNREGKNVAKTVKLVNKFFGTVIEKDAEDEFVIDTSKLEKGVYSVQVLFEDEGFDGIMMYMFDIK